MFLTTIYFCALLCYTNIIVEALLYKIYGLWEKTYIK